MTRAGKPAAGKTLLGAPAGDAVQLAGRLQRRWNPKESVSAFKLKLEDYTNRLGPLELHSKSNDKELEILQRVVEEGEQALKLQESEVATVAVLKTGMREYIDYALDEVDRYTRVTKLGASDSFNWRAQGHPDNVPPLRCSQVVHMVSDDMPHGPGSLAERTQETWHPYAKVWEAATTHTQKPLGGDTALEWSLGESRFSVV